MSSYGRLDGMLHAAGIVRRQEDMRETTDDQWARMMTVNLDASFRLARACLRVMAPRGSGSIVLVGSQLAHVAAPGYASYCASKGGTEALVRALAVDFGPSGIRVNSLTPGVVHTPLAYVDRPDFDDQVEAIAARIPLRRIGQPEGHGRASRVPPLGRELLDDRTEPRRRRWVHGPVSRRAGSPPRPARPRPTRLSTPGPAQQSMMLAVSLSPHRAPSSRT